MTAGAIAVPTIIPLRPPVPGLQKTSIDSNTLIEVRSETPGVTIYYTTNGAKPEPFLTVGPAAKSTYKYKQPFRLAGGKKTIKAIAVSQDGLQDSHMVSKTFDVTQVEPDYVDEYGDGLDFVNEIPGSMKAKKEVTKFAGKMMTSKEAWAEVQRMREREDMMKSGDHKGPNNTRNLDNLWAKKTAALNGYGVNGETMSLLDTLSKSRWKPPDSATQALRLQRETDFLKCVYCMAPRPSDPYARFCNECGNTVPALPQTRMPPPEPGQMVACIHCNSLVPFNSPSCLICEAPMAPQNTPMASVKLSEKLVCNICGTANPANLSSCVTCENSLQNSKRLVSAPPAFPSKVTASGDGLHLTCSKCGRVNNSDARFCDWCGAKPSASASSIQCSRCQASNQPYAKFCATCGSLVEPPAQTDFRNTGVSLTLNSELGGKNAQSQWLPVALPGRPVPTKCIATQTVGLFFPSQREIDKKIQEEEDQLALEKQMRDRKPLLTAVSPGRGYWRKQMDHIVTHLKAHAQNNAEFRALIAEPRMGKILSTAVHEDGYELSLTVNFALRGTKDPLVGEKMNYTTREYLSTYTEGRKSSLSRQDSQESLVSGISTARKTKKVKKVKKKKEEDKQSEEDKKLLKEVLAGGEGSAAVIKELIDDGADPNSVNKKGFSALHLAVLNKHKDAITALVESGADPNIKGPNNGNTPLHDAVSLGTSGLEVIDALLANKANPQKKNDKGETPYDLAIKGGYESVGNRLASSLGQSTLNRLIKPKSKSALDDF